MHEPLCRHDHRLKTVGRWRLHQPEPGHFTWLSPLGRKYRTQPPPILDELHEPRRDITDHPPWDNPDDGSPILQRSPPRPDRPPPPAPSDPDEPPPF
ncbi:MAG TPA: hypothetical protein VF003_18770 [Pseudonocardiaceae bacterium]